MAYPPPHGDWRSVWSVTLVAITGAGGFIGRRLVERVRERGWTARGLEIAEAAARRAQAAGAETIVGDVNDPAAVDRLCRGADVIIHTAALVEEDGVLERYRHVNVEGPRAVASAAVRAGAKRFVHLSSVMVYGFDFPANVDEDGPQHGEGNAYCQTKIESEVAVGSVHGHNDLGVVIIRPGDVYGPGGPQWVARPIDLMRKRLFALPRGGRGILNHVYVDNLIDGILLAVEAPKGDRPLVLNVSDGIGTTCADYFGRLATLAGLAAPRRLPSPVLRTMVGGVERLCLLIGVTPPARVAAVRYLERPHAYGIARARTLGYSPRVTLDEGMARVGQWLASS